MIEMRTSTNKIKQLLNIWGKAEKICREKTERVYELKKLCKETGDIRSKELNGLPCSKTMSSHIENSVIKTIDVYEKTIARLEHDITEVLSIKANIDSWVSFLEHDEQKILTLRYRDGLSWDYIPDIIHKSRMQCFRIHNKVINKINEEKPWNFSSTLLR